MSRPGWHGLRLCEGRGFPGHALPQSRQSVPPEPIDAIEGLEMPTAQIPRTIFKYHSLSMQSIMNLKRHVVYFGSPSSFNDPFDCALFPRFSELTEIEANAVCAKMISAPGFPEEKRTELLAMPQAEWMEMIKRFTASGVADSIVAFNQHRGVTCFSECNDNMLMWSHYGGQHRGFCLEFKTQYEPFSKLRQVRYSQEMPELDLRMMLIERDFDPLIEELFCTKSIDWAYEREWRAMHVEASKEYTYTGDALSAVYFGAKMTKQEIDTVALIVSVQDPGVKMYQGRKSESAFRIEFDEVKYTTIDEARRQGQDIGTQFGDAAEDRREREGRP